MHVLVTGGEGYVANHYIKKMLSKGHSITTLDSGFSSKLTEFDYAGQSLKLRRFKASVANIDVVNRALEGVDMIVHMAARMDWNLAYRHIIRLTEANVKGTANILAMARRAGVNKIIHISSAAVYGNMIEARETDMPVPINLYGATKLAGEQLARGFYNEYGLDVVILRPFNIWGGTASGSVVDKMVRDPHKTPLYYDGSQTRDFVHITDVVDAIYNAYMWDSMIYNICTGAESSISGVWSILYPEVEPNYVPNPKDRSNEIMRSVGDPGFVTSITGWKPTVVLPNLTREEIINFSTNF